MAYVGGRKEYTAAGPRTGRVYTYREASTAETLGALGGLPALTKAAKDEIDGPREAEYRTRVLTACVLSPVVVRDGEPGPEDKDWIAVSDIPNAEAGWLSSMILNGPPADIVDEARRAL